jgi:hypothetical protein
MAQNTKFMTLPIADSLYGPKHKIADSLAYALAPDRRDSISRAPLATHRPDPTGLRVGAESSYSIGPCIAVRTANSDLCIRKTVAIERSMFCGDAVVIRRVRALRRAIDVSVALRTRQRRRYRHRVRPIGTPCTQITSHRRRQHHPLQARIAYGADGRAGRASAPGSTRSFDGKHFNHEAPRKPLVPAPVIETSRSPAGWMPVGDGPSEAARGNP